MGDAKRIMTRAVSDRLTIALRKDLKRAYLARLSENASRAACIRSISTRAICSSARCSIFTKSIFPVLGRSAAAMARQRSFARNTHHGCFQCYHETQSTHLVTTNGEPRPAKFLRYPRAYRPNATFLRAQSAHQLSQRFLICLDILSSERNFTSGLPSQSSIQ
jgi:hypothetical protein